MVPLTPNEDVSKPPFSPAEALRKAGHRACPGGQYGAEPLGGSVATAKAVASQRPSLLGNLQLLASTPSPVCGAADGDYDILVQFKGQLCFFLFL